MLKYADEVTCICPILKNSDNCHILEEHEHFVSWANSKGLILNSSKCKWLKFCTAHVSDHTLPNIPIPTVK